MRVSGSEYNRSYDSKRIHQISLPISSKIMTNALTEITETFPTVIYLGHYDTATTHFNEMGTQIGGLTTRKVMVN